MDVRRTSSPSRREPPLAAASTTAREEFALSSASCWGTRVTSTSSLRGRPWLGPRPPRPCAASSAVVSGERVVVEVAHDGAEGTRPTSPRPAGVHEAVTPRRRLGRETGGERAQQSRPQPGGVDQLAAGPAGVDVVAVDGDATATPRTSRPPTRPGRAVEGVGESAPKRPDAKSAPSPISSSGVKPRAACRRGSSGCRPDRRPRP